MICNVSSISRLRRNFNIIRYKLGDLLSSPGEISRTWHQKKKNTTRIWVVLRVSYRLVRTQCGLVRESAPSCEVSLGDDGAGIRPHSARWLSTERSFGLNARFARVKLRLVCALCPIPTRHQKKKNTTRIWVVLRVSYRLVRTRCGLVRESAPSCEVSLGDDGAGIRPHSARWLSTERSFGLNARFARVKLRLVCALCSIPTRQK